MSRDTTSKYRLEITCKGFYTSPMSWKGRATDKRLEEWVAQYEASCLPGGANAHLGDGGKVTRACIYVNDGGYTLVASYDEPVTLHTPGCGTGE